MSNRISAALFAVLTAVAVTLVVISGLRTQTPVVDSPGTVMAQAESSEDLTVVVEQEVPHPEVPPEVSPMAPVYQPEYSPWSPGTAVILTTHQPVPGETIQVRQCTVAYSFSTGIKAYAVTASHCGETGQFVWSTAGPEGADFTSPVGQVIYSDLYRPDTHGLDVGIIEITDATRPMVSPDPGQETWLLEQPTPFTSAVCKFGQTTGETCGSPLDNGGVEILADQDGRELRATAATAAVCARAGDSGGPVFADIDGRRVIIGLVSGTRDPQTDLPCGDPSLAEMTMSYTTMPELLRVVSGVVSGVDQN